MDWSLESDLSKYNNVIKLKLNNIFGSRIGDFLEVVKSSKLGTLTNAKEVLEIISESDYADQLTRFFPFVFEMIVNELIHRIIGTEYIFRNTSSLKLNNKNEKEFDGIFENEKELLIVESKFHKKNMIKWEEYRKEKLRDDCAKYFFVEKLEFIKEWQLENDNNKELKLVFVSANGFWKDAYENINTIDGNHKHDLFDFLTTANDLIELCKKRNISSKPYSEWLTKYYIRNLKSKTQELEDIDIIEEIIEF